jgi:hypothetical protein
MPNRGFVWDVLHRVSPQKTIDWIYIKNAKVASRRTFEVVKGSTGAQEPTAKFGPF